MNSPAVVLADEDNASGMAMMLADLLTSNVRDFPSRRRATRLARGEVVFSAADHDTSVTLAFGSGRIEVRDGASTDAPVIAAPWLAMAKVCSGTLSPWAAWRSGDLKIGNLRRGPIAAAASSWALSVPASFYAADGASATPAAGGSTGRRSASRRFSIAAGIAVGTLTVGVILVVRHNRRSRRLA